MTEAAVLQDKIVKKQAQIEKLEKKLDKLTLERDSESKFLKHYDYLISWGNFEERKADLWQDWLKDHDTDIKWCKQDIENAKITLQKYQNALMLVNEKESRPVITVIKEFLDHWKQEILDFTLPLYEKYRQASHEYCDTWNSYRGEDRKEKLEELQKKERALLSISWVRVRYDRGSDKEFNIYLDKYMKDRYYELVEKITKVTGEITDVSSLYVGPDGRINGVVLGTNGKAKLETIIAGGYNENIIVNVKHGQCAHYRVLVHEIK